MNIALTFFLFYGAACKEISGNSQVVDWSAVQNKIFEIHDVLKNFMDQIIEVAIKDNAPVGNEIKTHLQSATIRDSNTLDRMKEEIAQKTLTIELAKKYFFKYKEVIAAIHFGLYRDLRSLTPDSSSKIQDILYATYCQTENKAQEVYVLLSCVDQNHH